MVSLPLANEPTLKVPGSLLRSDRGKTDPDRPLYLLPQSQRIEIRMLVTTEAVCLMSCRTFTCFTLVSGSEIVESNVKRLSPGGGNIHAFESGMIRFDSRTR